MAHASDLSTMRREPPALRLAPDASLWAESPRALRLVPEQSAHVLCLVDPPGEVVARIHSRLAVTLLRAPAFVTVESSRTRAADRDQILIVPPLHLCALRAGGQAGPGSVTLLLEAADLEGLAAPEGPALVTDPECVAHLSAAVAQWQRLVGVMGRAPISRSLLERLAAHATPLVRARSVGRSLAPVRRHLHAHLGELVPTAVLAEMVGLTESHLIRAFHQEFGLPPHAYHLRLRLARAVDLLGCGLPVATVASECGFADQSHLSRKFKEVYGLTPAAWGAGTAGVGRAGSNEQQPMPPHLLEPLPAVTRDPRLLLQRVC